MLKNVFYAVALLILPVGCASGGCKACKDSEKAHAAKACDCKESGDCKCDGACDC